MAPPNDISSMLGDTAEQYGIDPNDFAKMAQIESGGNPNATNPSGASGLFQFMPETAKQYGLSNPLDPAANADAAARLWNDNAKSLGSSLGRDPTSGEIYLAHQQGASGAASLLKNPDALASDIVGQKAVLANGGYAGETAGDFAQHWTSRFDSSDAPARTGGYPTIQAAQAAQQTPSAPATDFDGIMKELAAFHAGQMGSGPTIAPPKQTAPQLPPMRSQAVSLPTSIEEFGRQIRAELSKIITP